MPGRFLQRFFEDFELSTVRKSFLIGVASNSGNASDVSFVFFGFE